MWSLLYRAKSARGKKELREWEQLGREALRVAGEERRFTNVGQAEEEHDNTLQSDATTGVRRTSKTKRVQVALDLLKVEAMQLGAFLIITEIKIGKESVGEGTRTREMGEWVSKLEGRWQLQNWTTTAAT